MVSERVHAPENIIQAISHPREGHARTHIAGGKHPMNLFPTQTAVTRIGDKKRLVVPVDKSVLQCRQISEHSDDENENGNYQSSETRGLTVDDRHRWQLVTPWLLTSSIFLA
jgi:hypothetical protein